MNIIFLDYDGVVNTPMWNSEGTKCLYGFPNDNSVNNFQAVQWVSEFCQKYDYKIVVSSTWRMLKNYADCLINGGLRDGVDIIGKTPFISDKTREYEIQEYIISHKDEIDNFIIIDDDEDMGDYQDRLVTCDTTRGFGLHEFHVAERIHNRLENKKIINC